MSNSPLIHSKLIACMREVEAIGKNSKNQQQGFAYRGIDSCYNALNPILAKHGVFTVPEVISVQREERQTKSGGNLLYSIVTMKHHFYAEDGSSVSTTVVGEGMDSGDKSCNKSMAVAHKYALLQIFCIPTEDIPDPDAETHQVERKASKPAVESRGTPVENIKPVTAATEKQLRFFAGASKTVAMVEKVMKNQGYSDISEFTEEIGLKTLAWIEDKQKEAK